MKSKILEINDRLKNNKITSEKAQYELCVLFGIIKHPIKLSVDQEERIEKHWDKNIVIGLMTSNYPTDMMEYKLKSILSIDNHQEFIEKSKEMDLLKND